MAGKIKGSTFFNCAPLFTLLFVTLIPSYTISLVVTTTPSPSSPATQYCPIHRDLNEFNAVEGRKLSDNENDGDSESSSSMPSRVIDLSKIESRKVTINFYTPNPAKLALERGLIEETTVAFPYFVDDTTASVIPLVPIVHPVPALGQPPLSSASSSSSSPSPSPSQNVSSSDMDGTTVMTTTVGSGSGTEDYTEAGGGAATEAAATVSASDVHPSSSSLSQDPPELDVMCQWEFKATNESEYLLLTFNNLSAPYSTDCSEAYVAMQKDNGYESRWCGTRRQMNQSYIDFNDVFYLNWGFVPVINHVVYEEYANARPMALFSKRNAKVTVFRKADSSVHPPTGFSVTVESIQTENSLRVLLHGK